MDNRKVVQTFCIQEPLFALRDNKAGVFIGVPMMIPDEATAKRQISMNIAGDKEKKSMLARFPSDFELWCLGMYDKVNGKLMQDPERGEPRFITNVNDLVIREDKDE